jgi:hypothetical protein
VGAESGCAVGVDGEWKLAGLPCRAERVAAEIKALRRLDQGFGSGSKDSGGDGGGGGGGGGGGVRALFPAIHDFFILKSTSESTTESTKSNSDAAAVPRSRAHPPSSVVCHTVMTRCPGGKDLMALLAAAPGPGLPESQVRGCTSRMRLTLSLKAPGFNT